MFSNRSLERRIDDLEYTLTRLEGKFVRLPTPMTVWSYVNELR